MDNFTITPEQKALLEEMILRELEECIKNNPDAEDYCIRVDIDDNDEWIVSTVDMCDSLSSDNNAFDCPNFELMTDLNLDRPEEEWVGEFEDWVPNLEAVRNFVDEIVDFLEKFG